MKPVYQKTLFPDKSILSVRKIENGHTTVIYYDGCVNYYNVVIDEDLPSSKKTFDKFLKLAKEKINKL